MSDEQDKARQILAHYRNQINATPDLLLGARVIHKILRLALFSSCAE